MENHSWIEKDVFRTDPNHPFYQLEDPKTKRNVHRLFRILTTFSMMHQEENIDFVQGMADLASPLLYVFHNEADAYWAFDELMSEMVLPSLLID